MNISSEMDYTIIGVGNQMGGKTEKHWTQEDVDSVNMIIESLNLKIKISCLAFFVGPNVRTVQETISLLHGPKKSKKKKILKFFL